MYTNFHEAEHAIYIYIYSCIHYTVVSKFSSKYEKGIYNKNGNLYMQGIFRMKKSAKKKINHSLIPP